MTLPAMMVVIDVDGCVNLLEPHAPTRPGLPLLCKTLRALGYTIHLWSAGGEDHAQLAAENAGIAPLVTACHAKPDYPMSEAAALRALKARPALQVDDDPTERVADWPFMLWDETTHDEEWPDLD